MKYLDSLREGMRISEVYLCKTKQIALTKTGKEYGNLILQDKTCLQKTWIKYVNRQFLPIDTSEVKNFISKSKGQLTESQ